MTRLTALLLATDPGVHSAAFGPIEGKYGLYVGTIDETPSGCGRLRTLLTSEPVYESAEAAKAAADALIAEAKGGAA